MKVGELMRETNNLEFKETITNTFLKTVSAFANYGDGEIKFGIKDDGTVVGVKDPVQTCLNIENKINDAFRPQVDYRLHIDEQTNVITLKVYQGLYPPYFYKEKAYKRNASASVPVDSLELSRLILEGQNRSYDSLLSHATDLHFSILEKALQKKIGIKKLTSDLLITLGLREKDGGYTNAGALFADENDYRGIDLVKFGDNINVMLDRTQVENVSILKLYQDALQKYRQYYQNEVIDGAYRRKIEQIPEEAFREAIANAIVHRTWDVNAQIKVAMFDDRIEVTSPGGLPKGLSKEEYLAGQLYILRNPIIANIFFRLGLIEQFGTGIQRILAAYADSKSQPQFLIYENSIKIILPVVKTELQGVSKDGNEVYTILQNMPLSSSNISQETSFSKNKVLKLLDELIQKGYVVKIGNGRGTRYRRSK